MTSQACAPWCGTRISSAADRGKWYRRDYHGSKGFCSAACFAADEPLHPREVHNFADCIKADGDKPCRDCAEYALDAVGAPREVPPTGMAPGEPKENPYVQASQDTREWIARLTAKWPAQPPAPTGSGTGTEELAIPVEFIADPVDAIMEIECPCPHHAMGPGKPCYRDYPDVYGFCAARIRAAILPLPFIK